MAMEINSIAITQMNNGAHFAFIAMVVKLAEQDGAVNGFCNQVLAALRTAKNNEDEVLVLSNKSAFTQQIAKADAERDKMYSILKVTARSWRNFPVGDVSSAAVRLNNLLSIYKISPKDQYDKQSGLMANLIQELQGNYRQDVQRMGLESVVGTMKAANDMVMELLVRRSREEAGREIGRVKAARRASDEAYLEFVKSVNAHAYLNQGHEFDAFIGTLNQEIIRYKEQVLKQPTHEPEASPSDPVAYLSEDDDAEG